MPEVHQPELFVLSPRIAMMSNCYRFPLPKVPLEGDALQVNVPSPDNFTGLEVTKNNQDISIVRADRQPFQIQFYAGNTLIGHEVRQAFKSPVDRLDITKTAPGEIGYIWDVRTGGVEVQDRDALGVFTHIVGKYVLLKQVARKVEGARKQS